MRSELFDGADLVLVQARALAVQLLEFVEARVFIVLRCVGGLDLATVIQGNDGGRCAASEGAQAQDEQEGG